MTGYFKTAWKPVIVLLLVALLLGLLTSCAAYPTKQAYNERLYYQEGAYDAAAEPAPEPMPPAELAEEAVSSPSAPVIPDGGVGESSIRYEIRNGSMDLTVTDTRETVDQIHDLTAGAGGIVSESYVYTIEKAIYHASMTLRVPENKFEAVMKQIEGLGKASNVRTGRDDVTMTYINLEARLKSLDAQEKRLREILEIAETVEEVLSVEKELGRVRSDIEAMTAQFEILQDQVRFSTILVYIMEEQIATAAVSPDPFTNLGARMREALVRSINLIFSGVAALLVLFTTLLPGLVILAFAIVVLVVVARRLSRRPPRST